MPKYMLGREPLALAGDALPNLPGVYIVRLAMPPPRELGLQLASSPSPRFSDLLNERLNSLLNATIALKASGDIKEGWAGHLARFLTIEVTSASKEWDFSELFEAFAADFSSLLEAYLAMVNTIGDLPAVYVGRATRQPLRKRLNDHSEERTELLQRLRDIGVTEYDAEVHWASLSIKETSIFAAERMTQLLHQPKLSKL